MELSRRDAVAALGALGATGGLGAVTVHLGRDDASGSHPDDHTVTRVQRAMATVLYPDEVTGVGPFVDRFLAGRLDGSEHAAGMRDTIGDLQAVADDWYQTDVPAMSAAQRDRFLVELGADTAAEDPTGTLAERTRFFVVNELLLALYTSPTGGELVGLENPQGHPGGSTSYTLGSR